MLSKINLNDPNGLVHFLLVMLSFSNSFMNPILYGVYSSEFRHDYKKVFQKIFCMSKMTAEVERAEIHVDTGQFNLTSTV